MTTRFTKTLAIVLISACGTSLIGTPSATAQTSGGFTARPLPPLPNKTPSSSQLDADQRFNTTVMPAINHNIASHNFVNHDIEAGRLPATQAPPTPARFEAPPVPPGFEASAKIVKFEGEPDQAESKTQASSTKFTVSPQRDAALPAPTARVAELINAGLDAKGDVSEGSANPGRYLVSFAKTAQDVDLQAELDAASSKADTPEPAETGSPDTTQDNSESDALKDLESDMEINDREMRNSEREDQDDEEGDDSDDLDDLDLDDEDRPKRKPRQFGVWPKKTIRETRVDVRDTADVIPKDESGVLTSSSQRYYGSEGTTEKVFAWEAPNIRYQPLYFEDVALERYGQTKGLVKQPIVSAYKFLRDGALLHYNARIDNPYSCDGPLGFCRPGSPTVGCGCAKCKR